MIEPTEQERREMNEKLARAMGWKKCDPYQWGSFCWFAPKGSERRKQPPDYTGDPAASRELVLWLAADRKKRERFVSALVPVRLTFTSTFMSVQEWAAMVNQVASALMTADPLIIARAAAEAVGGNNER